MTSFETHCSASSHGVVQRPTTVDAAAAPALTAHATGCASHPRCEDLHHLARCRNYLDVSSKCHASCGTVAGFSEDAVTQQVSCLVVSSQAAGCTWQMAVSSACVVVLTANLDTSQSPVTIADTSILHCEGCRTSEPIRARGTPFQCVMRA